MEYQFITNNDDNKLEAYCLSFENLEEARTYAKKLFRYGRHGIKEVIITIRLDYLKKEKI